MGYVDENLITEEAVTYRGRLHWGGLAGPAVLAGASIVLFAASRMYVDMNSTLFTMTGVVLVILGSVPHV